MTITLAQNAARVSYSVSEGATQTSFTVSFEFFDAADLNVYVDGTLKTISTHYTVSGGSGSTGAVAISVTGASGGSTVVITRSIALARTTDFPSSGPFQIGTLNTELDRFTAIAADLKDSVDRSLQLTDFDSAVSLVLPAVADRKGKVLAFNASTGAVEAGPSTSAVQSVADNAAAVNLLGTAAVVEDMGLLATSAVIEDMGLLATSTVIEDMGLLATSAVIEDMGLLATSVVIEDMGLLGTSANVTAMGLLGNSTVITNISNLSASAVIADMAILGTTDAVADMAILGTSDVVADMNTLATSDIVSDMNTLATSGNVTAMGLLGNSTTVTNMGLLGTSAAVADMALLGTSAVVADMAILGTTDVVADMNTLATSDIISDLNTLATSDIVTDMNLLATSANVAAMGKLGVDAVIADMALLGTDAVVADLEILGTTDVVADMNTLATSDIVSDMNTLATSANVTAMGLLGTSAVVTDMGLLGTAAVVEDMGILATSANVTAMSNVSGSISNVNTVASNISGVNDFAARYRVGSSDPSSNNDDGDLFYNTTSDALKVYNAGASAWQAGVSLGSTPTFTSQTTGQINNTDAFPDIRPSLLLDFANSKTLDPRITFTRGSTATYYDGVTTAKAEENLFKYSQEFDNAAWGKNDSAVSANSIAAPDGTTTADTVTADGGSSIAHGVSLTTAINSAAATFSVYAKKGSQSVLQIFFYGPADTIWQNYNLDNGSLGSGGGSSSEQTSQTITDVGNGWYRCTVSGDFASKNATDLLFTIKSSATSARAATETNSGTIYLWGAQLEERSAATAYTPTTSSPIVKYQPALQTAASGAARFDHDPTTGESKGLLIEEARTNLAPYSQTFDNAQWSKGNITVTADQATAPDGTLSADLIQQTTGTGYFSIEDGISLSSSTTYTASFFLKYAGEDNVEYGVFDSTDGHMGQVDFQFSTETLTLRQGTNAGFTDVGNGWYRLHVTFLTGATLNGPRLRILLNSGSSGTGDDWSAVLAWGAQLEAGAFPTSYIPTSGSTVTRARDDADVTGTNFSQWFNPTEGTILTDFEYNYKESGSGYPRIWSITEDGGSQSRMSVLVNENANGLTQEVYSFNVNQVSIAYQLSNLTGSATAKSSFAYAEDNFGVSANGSLGTDTSGTVATSPPRARMRLGSLTSSSGDHRQTWIKKWAFYPKRLSNATLQAMTSE